jgi:hypothetical protein
LYDLLGIEKVGDLNGNSLQIHFKDSESFHTWTSKERRLIFVATDNTVHNWEGEYTLGSDTTVENDDDRYTFAKIEDINEGIVNGYTQATQDFTQDILTIEDGYESAHTKMHIEYDLQKIGIGLLDGAALADFVASAGDNSHVLDMTLR